MGTKLIHDSFSDAEKTHDLSPLNPRSIPSQPPIRIPSQPALKPLSPNTDRNALNACTVWRRARLHYTQGSDKNGTRTKFSRVRTKYLQGSSTDKMLIYTTLYFWFG